MTRIRLTSEITVTPLRVLGDDTFVIGGMKVLPEVPLPDPSDRGRIRYLMQHRHGTPFEHNCIILHVNAPIFVWREWHRHRIGFAYDERSAVAGDPGLGFSFNEESARYKQLDPVFFIPARDRPMIKVGDGWKPGRPKFLTLDEEQRQLQAVSMKACPIDVSAPLADAKYTEIVDDMSKGYADEYERYERQLARNLDPGLARDNLPVGIFSACWVTCNLRSALAFLSLRTHEPAAKYVSYPLHEIERAGRQLEAEVAKAFPISYEAFNEFGRVAP